MPGIKTSIDKTSIDKTSMNKIFVMIMLLQTLGKYCAMKIWSYTVHD